MAALKPGSPRILYSCYSNISRDGEQFVPEHIFGFIMSGRSDLNLNGKNYSFNEGDFRFLRKNQLIKFAKYPPANGDFKTLSVVMDQQTLRDISAEHDWHATKPYTGENALTLNPNPLFRNFMASLTPYLDNTGELNSMIAALKVKEAIMILLQTNPGLKDVLFDFTEPGKVDLEAYMTAHYKFNVDINRFAYLTGRSLATFKRDFEKIFNTSPNRWLQQKRLHDAYFLLKEKGQKVSDVYVDVGFKDLSHFSFAFKKAFGITPSKLVS